MKFRRTFATIALTVAAATSAVGLTASSASAQTSNPYGGNGVCIQYWAPWKFGYKCLSTTSPGSADMLGLGFTVVNHSATLHMTVNYDRYRLLPDKSKWVHDSTWYHDIAPGQTKALWTYGSTNTVDVIKHISTYRSAPPATRPAAPHRGH